MAERAFTRALGATCASPVAAFCVLEDGDLRMRGAAVQRRRQRDGRGSRGVRLRRRADADGARPRRSSPGAGIDPEAVRRAMRRVLVLRPRARRERDRRRGARAWAWTQSRSRCSRSSRWLGRRRTRAVSTALLLTSANARAPCAATACRQLRGLPVYAVGEATAEAARDAGFDIASIGDAGVDRLLGSIEPDFKLLHLAGEDGRAPRRARRTSRRHRLSRDSRRAPDLPPGARRGRADPFAARRPPLCRARRWTASTGPSPSPRSARQPPRQRAAAGQRSQPPKRPTDEALLALAERLCNNLAPK